MRGTPTRRNSAWLPLATAARTIQQLKPISGAALTASAMGRQRTAAGRDQRIPGYDPQVWDENCDGQSVAMQMNQTADRHLSSNVFIPALSRSAVGVGSCCREGDDTRPLYSGQWTWATYRRQLTGQHRRRCSRPSSRIRFAERAATPWLVLSGCRKAGGRANAAISAAIPPSIRSTNRPAGCRDERICLGVTAFSAGVFLIQFGNLSTALHAPDIGGAGNARAQHQSLPPALSRWRRAALLDRRRRSFNLSSRKSIGPILQYITIAGQPDQPVRSAPTTMVVTDLSRRRQRYRHDIAGLTNHAAKYRCICADGDHRDELPDRPSGIRGKLAALESRPVVLAGTVTPASCAADPAIQHSGAAYAVVCDAVVKISA